MKLANTLFKNSNGENPRVSEQIYDILIKNAAVIDPEAKTSIVQDLAIKDGIIAKISKNIPIELGWKVVDATNLYLTPGLIDVHTHCFHTSGIPQAWAGDYSLNPDTFSFRCGVTTVIDTGSSGHLNFPQFYSTVIRRCKTRVLALLNIADWGMMSLQSEQFPEYFDIDACIATAKEFPGTIVGIKIAHYWRKDWEHVNVGIEVGEACNLPLMVDFGQFKKERPLFDLLKKLRKGDILTHMYRAPVPFLDKQGKVYEYLHEARKKGILFDLGHGQGSFVFRNAAPAIEQGFYPDFISTDIHALSMNVGCQDMLSVMSKCLAMGMSFEEIIKRSTTNPVKAFNLKGLGTIREGALADLALFSILEGDFGYKDIGEAVLKSSKRIFCEMTIKDGELQWDWNGRIGQDYKTLPDDYGMNYNADELVHPE